MKRLISFLVVLSVMFGLSSAALAQDDPEVEVEVEGEVGADPAAGDTITVRVKKLDPDTEVAIKLGEVTGSAVADADGVAEAEIVVPDAPGEIDGIVTIDGVDVPFKVVVLAADGTAVPSAVNTGDGLETSSNSAPLYFAAAAALLLLSGGALALRRYQAGTSTV
jgi:hypothetical protein